MLFAPGMSERSLSKRPSKGDSPATERASRKRRSGDKRERILAAATKVFARSGFHATRVSDIARVAGVADGTIYLYFESKEDLLVSLFDDRISRLLAHIDALPREASPSARLRAVVELQLGLLEGERELAEVITVILRQSNRLLREFAVPKFLTYLDRIASIVADGQACGEFRGDVSPHVMARAIFGALDGITFTWAYGKAEPGALGRAASQLSELLIRGMAS